MIGIQYARSCSVSSIDQCHAIVQTKKEEEKEKEKKEEEEKEEILSLFYNFTEKCS